MEFKIVVRYYPVKLTKRSQICKSKQFYKKIGQHKDNWQHNDKIDKFFNNVFGFQDI